MSNRIRWFTFIAVFVLLGVFLSNCCGVKPSEQVPVSTIGTSEYWPTENWRTATPEEQGMDSEILADMLEMVHSERVAIDSIMVVRNGFLVLDAYIYPFHPGEKHIIHSCTKSIVSALIGIAIDQGYIEGVDQSLVELFPDRTIANLDSRKKALTLEHLLTMSSGLNCRDSYLYRWSGLRQMKASEDWVQFMLDLPMLAEPGTQFEYCNGASFLLSAIINEKTGKSALEFAREYLFSPLGINDLDWPANHQDISIGWGELRMSPHDMAKIGYLYLNEGRWGDRQVVPADWVVDSTHKHISATLQDGYGYQWWVTDSGVYLALGYAGQFIYVIPEKDMVVVFTSDLEDRDFYTPQDLLNEYILPSAGSTISLPVDTDGLMRLQAALDTLTNP